MNLVLLAVICAFTLFHWSSANPACFTNINDYKPHLWTTKEAFQETLNKAFNELYNESAPHQPLNIEFCAKLGPEGDCMRLSPYTDTKCSKMALNFTLDNKLRAFGCNFPRSEQCQIKCNMWIGDFNVTIIYHTGQTFKFGYSWLEPVEAILQTQVVPSAPIAKITSFKYGDQSEVIGYTSTLDKSTKETLPKGPCIRDVRNAYKDVVFRAEAVRDKLVKQ